MLTSANTIPSVLLKNPVMDPNMGRNWMRAAGISRKGWWSWNDAPGPRRLLEHVHVLPGVHAPNCWNHFSYRMEAGRAAPSRSTVIQPRLELCSSQVVHSGTNSASDTNMRIPKVFLCFDHQSSPAGSLELKKNTRRRFFKLLTDCPGS